MQALDQVIQLGHRVRLNYFDELARLDLSSGGSIFRKYAEVDRLRKDRLNQMSIREEAIANGRPLSAVA